MQNDNGSLTDLLKLLAYLLVFLQLFNPPLLLVDLGTFENVVGSYVLSSSGVENMAVSLGI